jgi:D-sedoheptulose 7-phosphate isomerase
MNIIAQRIQESITSKNQLLASQEAIALIETIANTCIEALKNGHKLMFCGNGGSAVDSMHIAAELSGRYYKDRKPLDAEALSADNAFITAVANDYGYQHIFSRLVTGKGKKGDILFGLSTSGNSENVVEAFKVARQLGVITIGFTGSKPCKMDDLSDYLFKTFTHDTPRIQEMHMLAGHIICELVENAFLDS